MLSTGGYTTRRKGFAAHYLVARVRHALSEDRKIYFCLFWGGGANGNVVEQEKAIRGVGA